jgi:predicted porin
MVGSAFLVMFSLLHTGAANAQSSVTLYGILNGGIEYQTGLPHGNQLTAETGGWRESEVGMEGSEDLGGGTKAIFKLEAGIDIQNGENLSGASYGREATVGVSNDRFGTLRMGNLGAYEIQEDSWWIDPQVMHIFGIETLVRGRNWSYASNGFEYESPTWGGLVLKGQYDLTNSTTWNAGNPGSGPGQLGGPQGRSDGIKAQYQAAELGLIAIYDEIRDPNGGFSNVYVTSRSILGGATYAWGPVKLYGGYQHLSAPNASDEGYFGSATPTTLPGGVSLPTSVNHEWFGAAWQASAATSLTAAVYHANANNGNGNATMYSLSGQYNLSKRTSLHAEVAYIHNSSTSNIGLGNGYADPYGANANNDPVNGGTNASPDYGHGQLGVFAGILTSF